MNHILAWEGEYKRHGMLWRGAAEVEDIKSFIQQNAKILEVGCGNGKTLGQLLEKYDAVGVDISREALKFGGRNLISDARYLPFLNSFFDAVVCRFVLEHLCERERVQAVAEMRRVLRQNGLLFLRAFSTEDMRYSNSKNLVLCSEQNTFRRASGIICHYFTEFELRNLLRRFQILDFKVNRQKKIFDGKEYLRASFSVIASKGDGLDSEKKQ